MGLVFEMCNNERFPSVDEMTQAFGRAYADCNHEIYNASYDIRFSGSTCVTLLFIGNRMFVANVGDSRAIMLSFSEGCK